MFAHSARGAVLEKKKKKRPKMQTCWSWTQSKRGFREEKLFPFCSLCLFYYLSLFPSFSSPLCFPNSASLLIEILKWVIDPQFISISLGQFGLIDPFRSTLVNFSPFWYHWVSSVHFRPFSLFNLLRSILVHLLLFF